MMVFHDANPSYGAVARPWDQSVVKSRGESTEHQHLLLPDGQKRRDFMGFYGDLIGIDRIDHGIYWG